VSGCGALSDVGVISLARHGGRKLAEVDLSRCPRITDGGVEMLAQGDFIEF